eukprot:Blabericola_migrator_1__3189@NODE_1936_length_3537_cov_79_108934_g1237_i0_p1_GENE_NODE_1936_length_3537_cov_79_108934_g1237_i0NODE_1936_length_3537_cov_79_108934_g1237_i0_p1_ORF_typecomplete_len881_score73_51GTP_EFTU/PF00009_27/4_6e47GTP_EFTU/PF00009_27/3_3e03EFG_IV/PF03764_18/8_5e02EFG_IV/PF03764_18/3_1e17EFG_C/PF00679_24/1_1e15EFG_II/PF14492_6/3_6e15EFG_II/PF14492_6/3e03GTP_EFTU_D2/PF03144_25/2_5e12MMR_HSR1/PF01926_23/0_0007RsgA_GTPase/PF03193_16/1_5RsgA_GTPase/PF03193_16/13RF3_C/PF16658_5/0_0
MQNGSCAEANSPLNVEGPKKVQDSSWRKLLTSMVDLASQKMEAMMHNKKNIRNISVIAHVDHGKSTLIDTLVVKAKIAVEDRATDRYIDNRKDEGERGITIRSTAVSLNYGADEITLKRHMEQDYDGKEFLINLIDSPGHPDFISEVDAALRVTDGALVVVDCVDGIRLQTEVVLRQAVGERIRPVLVLNKLDRLLLELSSPIEETAVMLRQKVEGFNGKLEEIVSIDPDQRFSPRMDPTRSDVSFCSGLQGWGFTLRHFARFYLKRLNMDKREDGEAQICRLLWAVHVHFSSDDPWDTEGKLVKEPNPSRTFFIVFVLRPIYRVMDMCLKGDVKGIRSYLSRYEVDFGDVELKGEGKPLFEVVMRTWLPAADTLFEQIVLRLPSPVTSQAYRADLLYTGERDICLTSIEECDSSEKAPLMMFVSKMIPFMDNRFIAFGRVFSGTVRAGMEVRIQGPEYVPGTRSDMQIRPIQRVVVMMGRTFKEVTNCPAGNIIGLIGIDQALKKIGTITTHEKAHNIRSMKFNVLPVVKYAVRPRNLIDLAKLKDGLLMLGKSDPLCVVNCMDNGQLTVAGVGELHLEICLNDLRNEYAGVDIVIDEPMVSYVESVTKTIETPKMARSANGHNTISMTVEPLTEEITRNIENEKLVCQDPTERVQRFNNVLGIREEWVRKIMFYGPLDKGPNIMVDETKGVAHLDEIKEHLRAAFQHLTQSGPLIGEPLRGVRFNLTDCVLHTDATHRTLSQILSPTAQVCSDLMLYAKPILYEPVFRIEVGVSNDHIGTVSAALCCKRGTVTSTSPSGDMRSMIAGTLPVRESFGFNRYLTEETRGKATSTLSFSHYDRVPGSMSSPGSILYETVMAIREKRKMPPLKEADYYFDEP